MNDIKQGSANAQVTKLLPLLTLRLPATAGEEPVVYRFQSVTADSAYTFGGNTFEYLDARVDNVSGSQMPYSPYKYNMVINNSHRSGTINTNPVSKTSSFNSIRSVVGDNDGLRNGTLHIYYHHPDREYLDREAVFRIQSSSIGTTAIVIGMIAEFENIIPSRIL